MIEPELDKIREEIKEYIEQDEDVLTYALFPQPAVNYFKYRQAQNTTWMRLKQILKIQYILYKKRFALILF